MSDVQLYMNIYDIKPHEPLWERITDKHDPPEDWDKVDLINSIRAEGFKYQLNVDPDGNIRNGNARYWVARYLLEEEGDERFRYLPVQRDYAAGMFNRIFNVAIEKKLLLQLEGETREQHNKRVQTDMLKVTDEITLNIFKKFMNTKDKVIPSATTFEDYEIDPDNKVFLKRHWDQSSGEYTSLLQHHPKQEKKASPTHEVIKYVFMLVLEGHRSFEELLADERMHPIVKDIKQNYKNNKEEWENKQLLARIKREKKP